VVFEGKIYIYSRIREVILSLSSAYHFVNAIVLDLELVYESFEEYFSVDPILGAYGTNLVIFQSSVFWSY
jgi:hypothetical protein